MGAIHTEAFVVALGSEKMAAVQSWTSAVPIGRPRMEPVLVLSSESRHLAGILLLALVTVETGGRYLLKIITRNVAVTPFQTSFARAGHAHAGVLLILALLCQVFADATSQTGFLDWLSRSGVAIAAADVRRLFLLLDGRGQGAPEPSDRARVRRRRAVGSQPGQPRRRIADRLTLDQWQDPRRAVWPA